MAVPMVSFVVWNRMGLTVRNIRALLDTGDDFELHIIDSNSMDSTWEFLKELKDPRIKTITRFPRNRGPIYASNYALSRRRPGQYFIAMDSDVNIHTDGWVRKFTEVFEAFPEVGMLGVPKGEPYTAYLPPVLFHIKNGVGYLELKNASLIDPLDFVPGHLQCLRSEVIELIGYWSEEGHYGDAELSHRITHYTPYRVGYVTGIEIDQLQELPCSKCPGSQWCRLDTEKETCFTIRDRYYRNPLFAMKYLWRHLQTFEELKEGKRTAYCASIHDPASMEKYLYYKDWAEENFNFYE